MVTGDEEIKYGYLLDPCFQIVNTAGKPLTSGWIEVYIAGTRNKYYCSSDFAGTLHPFKIPLDSLGSNIILADVEKSYDVYVYNRFGNLAMSRYNITPGKGGAGGSISGSGMAEHWIGKNGQNISIPAGTDTALKLPLSYEYEGSFIDRINENRTAFYLKEGLYLVQAVVNFKQSDQSLTNEISQVDVFTRSDDTPEDMSFNRDMAGPDSSDDSHCLKVSFIRCVKEDDEVSQIVLFKVNTPNAWSECYLQNVQIARLSSGGAGAGGQTYYAGEYIAIDDETNTISVTGIEPENYATHDEIQSATSGFITSADLSGYATEQWVLDKHYITSADIPDIPDDLVTSAELAQTSGAIEHDIADLTSAISEALSDKMDKSSSADFYPRYDNPEGYLTSIPSEYVTDSEMSGYVHDHTSGFITSADLPDVSDMATKTWVTDQHYITSADVPPQVEYSAGDNIDITNHVVSVTDTSQLIAGDNVSITPSGNDYIISAQVPGTSGYVTEQEMNDAIQSATSAFITSADIPDLPEDLVTSGELATVSGEIVNQIPSLQGYATEEYVADYVTEHTSAFVDSAYVTDYVASQTSGKQDTLTFGYDESDKINAINGSAIAGGGGGGHEYSGANGVYVDNENEVIGLDTSASNAIETVIENSGAWGGAGLPISAGPGVRIRMDNGTLIAESDETMLYSGSTSWKDSITLTESPLNFSRIKVLFGHNLENTSISEKLWGVIEYVPFEQNNYLYLDGILRGNSREWHAVSLWSGVSGTSWNTVSGHLYGLASTDSNTNNLVCSPYQVIGINRKSGGN